MWGPFSFWAWAGFGTEQKVPPSAGAAGATNVAKRRSILSPRPAIRKMPLAFFGERHFLLAGRELESNKRIHRAPARPVRQTSRSDGQPRREAPTDARSVGRRLERQSRQSILSPRPRSMRKRPLQLASSFNEVYEPSASRQTIRKIVKSAKMCTTTGIRSPLLRYLMPPSARP